MKKVIMIGALVVALVGGAAGAVTSASAFPTKNKPCSTCHGSSSAVKIKLTPSATTTTTATYRIKVTGGSGKAGWAVFSGAANIRHKISSTGTFTVTRGLTYTVRAVKKGSGAAEKTLVVP